LFAHINFFITFAKVKIQKNKITMETKITKEGAQTIIKVDGRMDTLNAKEFEQSIQQVLQEAKPDVCIDCEDLEYISSSGLRVFMTILKYTNSVDGKLVLQKMRPDVKDVFDMTGFSALFNIE
jgi:anti-anti-sigma factor